MARCPLAVRSSAPHSGNAPDTSAGCAAVAVHTLRLPLAVAAAAVAPKHERRRLPPGSHLVDGAARLRPPADSEAASWNRGAEAERQVRPRVLCTVSCGLHAAGVTVTERDSDAASAGHMDSDSLTARGILFTKLLLACPLWTSICTICTRYVHSAT